MAALEIENLSLAYSRVPVLRGITLDVGTGELLALVGPNGAGKSSLIRAVSGVVLAASGSVRLGDEDLLALPPRERARRLAVVPQGATLPAAFTAAEVVLMGRTPHLGRREGKRDRDLAWEAMLRTGVAALAGRRIEELSGGECQRVLIARALAQEPRVLLLDEPTAHLDLKYQVEVLRLVEELACEKGLAVLATFHDLALAALHADRIALLVRGELRACGRVGEVLTAANLGAAYGLPVEVLPHPVHGKPLVVPVLYEPLAARDGGRRP